MAKLISGKIVSVKVRNEVKKETEELRENHGIVPGLAVILVGNDPASQVYVRNKQRACEEVGFHPYEYRMNENATQEQLLDLIGVLNKDNKVNGILVQLPLPEHIDEQAVIHAISPLKDVDAFHPVNVGKIMIGDYDFLPCTPAGIMELIASTGVDISGKQCVVIGRSNIVGKPMAQLMMQKQYGDATVTVCHSHTTDIKKECREADIIIAAIGKPDFVTADMVKEGAVVIDVGTTRVPDATRKSGFRLNGDVKFDEVAPKCSFITPVPGGVGPMTICSLMKNTLQAAKGW